MSKIAVVDTSVFIMMLDDDATKDPRRVQLVKTLSWLRDDAGASFVLPTVALAEMERLDTLIAGIQELGERVRAGMRVVEKLAGTAPVPDPVSSGIETVIARLSQTGGAPMSLAEAAALVHLSPSRFRHLFVAETGTTFRAYALWVRIQHAIVAMMAGRSWTDAAHAAGFADSAHLNRTFRRMFGISPNMLVRGP